jgi:hypothetical protein
VFCNTRLLKLRKATSSNPQLNRINRNAPFQSPRMGAQLQLGLWLYLLVFLLTATGLTIGACPGVPFKLAPLGGYKVALPDVENGRHKAAHMTVDTGRACTTAERAEEESSDAGVSTVCGESGPVGGVGLGFVRGRDQVPLRVSSVSPRDVSRSRIKISPSHSESLGGNLGGTLLIIYPVEAANNSSSAAT